MRLSPFVFTLLATSATLSLVSPAWGNVEAPAVTAPVTETEDAQARSVVSAAVTVPSEAIADTPDKQQPKVVQKSSVPEARVTPEPLQMIPATPQPPVAIASPVAPPPVPAHPSPIAAAPTAPRPTAADLESLPIPPYEPSEHIELPSHLTKHADLELAQFNLEGPAPEEPPTAPEPQVLVSEVIVTGPGLTPELENLVYDTIDTQPGLTTTRTQLQDDVNAIFATGYFANVTQQPEDTPLGVRVTFNVDVNPVLREVVVQTLPADDSDRVIPASLINDIFADDYNEVLNLRDLQLGIIRINEWYQENGYDLAQVVGNPQISPDGRVTLTLAEGVIERIQVRFIDEEEEVVEGRTRDFIVTREMKLASGGVFNRATAQEDLQRVFGLGLFEDVRLSFEPADDPAKVVVNVDVQESNTGSLAAGAGVSSASGFFGTASYQQQNLGGNNHTIGAELQVGTRELLFDLSFTDPWIAGDPYRTSYTVNMFRRRSISLIFDEGDPEIRLPDGDRPRIVRTGGGIDFNRPLSPDPFSRAEWTVSAGFSYQGIDVRDSDGDISPRDSLGNLLSHTPNGQDTLVTLRLGAVRDRRNSFLEPTAGSLLRLGMEQTVPVGAGTILFNRLRASYSTYYPVDWLNFTNDPEAPQALAFNLQGGTIIGDLPPYEAFSLGGANSVRGYKEGDVGSGRTYIQATAEYRFPILSFLGGAFFVDYGTDLGTGDNVPGNPAGVRGKPGDGLGYGVGVRIQSPLGPIRIDYGLNDQGDSRIHFGIGQRF
ncbi:BamA/TamA family outer membrane protein [Spirulina major]|uniref:BamA/TamA family outer membrane protein n=1 Tax=Spirulina major TaxID=270636 RepID=UPI00093523ED|nr:BamA/TamA family outer membrane protein [Spirulina major]